MNTIQTPPDDFQNLEARLPTLDDALEGPAVSETPPAPQPAPKPVQAFKPADLIGMIADISSLDLPPEVAKSYQNDYKGNPLVWMGVHASGICEALSKYGVGANGGAMPDWLKVLLGVGALTAGVVLTRRKYANGLNEPAPVADPAVADGGFAGNPGGFNPTDSGGFGFTEVQPS